MLLSIGCFDVDLEYYPTLAGNLLLWFSIFDKITIWMKIWGTLGSIFAQTRWDLVQAKMG